MPECNSRTQVSEPKIMQFDNIFRAMKQADAIQYLINIKKVDESEILIHASGNEVSAETTIYIGEFDEQIEKPYYYRIDLSDEYLPKLFEGFIVDGERIEEESSLLDNWQELV
jgi:hypothetical protein